VSLTVTLDTSSLTRLLNSLGDDVDAALRPVAQVGAQIVYEQMRANVRKLKTKTGNLERSIYQVYSKDQSSQTRAVYHISWNAKKAPHGVNVEYGHWVRYEYYFGKDGKPHIKVRPEKIGTPPPRKSASRSEKDAYYVLRAVPFRTVARSFARNATSAFPRAFAAMESELINRLAKLRSRQ